MSDDTRVDNSQPDDSPDGIPWKAVDVPKDDGTKDTVYLPASETGGPEITPDDARRGLGVHRQIQTARETVNLPGNERFIQSLTDAIQKGAPLLVKGVALHTLVEVWELYADAVGRLEDEDKSQVRRSCLLELDGGPVSQVGDIEAKMEEWKEDPPEPLRDMARELVEEFDPEKDAEWAGTHVFFWAARELNRDLQAAGRDPEDVPKEEWDRRFQERLFDKDRNYIGDAVHILTTQIGETAREGIRAAAEEQEWGILDLERVLGLEPAGDAPAPRPETPDHDPDPFTGPNETAGLLADSFSNIVSSAMMDASGEPAETKVGAWGRGPGGVPVRVEQLKNPYDGRAVLKVQAHADADPAEVEAAMGWEMLERMDMDTVWLHMLLLAHASAPHRDGREVMTIPRRRIENVMGFHRGDGKTVAERAERVREHVEALQSLYVQFQGVRRHGDKLHFEGDMTASPLWFVQMKAKGQGDLFTGKVTADWHVKAKEGVWGSEFLHNHGDQWAPLPKEWFDQIDRRGKDWTQRLLVRLAFLFRINAKRGGVVKLSAQKMLEICGAGTGGRKQRKTKRKRRLSASLDALRDRYGIDVQAGRVHIRHTSGLRHEDWLRRVAVFGPPDSIDGELLRGESDGRPRLPEVKGGAWTKDHIKRLRSDLGWSQSQLAERLGVSQGYVSQLESGTAKPSDEKCKMLDRLDSRHR